MTDWRTWSRQAVAEMEAQNRAWLKRYSLDGAHYRWDLTTGELIFTRPTDRVIAAISVIGTVSSAEGSFRWAWANEAIPSSARRGLDRVRAFGGEHGLALLTQPECPAGRAEGLELLAAAGRILGASGGFIDEAEDLTIFFTLSQWRVDPPPGER